MQRYDLSINVEPGDILGLISDGIFEYENDVGLQFGQNCQRFRNGRTYYRYRCTTIQQCFYFAGANAAASHHQAVFMMYVQINRIVLHPSTS